MISPIVSLLCHWIRRRWRTIWRILGLRSHSHSRSQRCRSSRYARFRIIIPWGVAATLIQHVSSISRIGLRSAPSMLLPLTRFGPTGALLQCHTNTASFSCQAVVHEQKETPLGLYRFSDRQTHCLSAAHAPSTSPSSSSSSSSPFGHFRGRPMLRPIMRTQRSSVWSARLDIGVHHSPHSLHSSLHSHFIYLHSLSRQPSCDMELAYVRVHHWQLISRHHCTTVDTPYRLRTVIIKRITQKSKLIGFWNQ